MASHPRSLWDLLENMVRRAPERIATITAHRDGERTLTYAQLLERVEGLAGGLWDRGYRPGDVIGVWLPNVPEWLIVEFAAARLGVVVVALNTRYRAKELVDILGSSEARGIVLPAEFLGIDFLEVLRSAAGALPTPDDSGPELPHLRDTIVVVAEDGVPLPDGTVAFCDLLSQRPDGLDPSRPDDVINLFGTSGTTGSPKIAAHLQSSVTRHALNDAEAFDIGPGDRSLCALPLSGVFGFNWALAAIAAGATCILQPAFDAAHAAELIAAHEVTHYTAADNMIRPILELEDIDHAGLSSWRRGGFGNFTGKPLELVALAEERVGVRLSGVYGASECMALVSTWPPEVSTETRALAGGEVVDSEIEVRAVDPESGQGLGDEEPGELQLRGYVVMKEYRANPEATNASFTEDGWYRTGDLGYTVGPGRFVYLARLKDSLRLRGFLVDPIEIEEHLNAHPAVRFSQVVGVRQDDGGDTAVAFVQPAGGQEVDEEELRTHCRTEMANYKVPGRVLFVESFPTVMGPNGEKIQKTRLRDMAEEELARDRNDAAATRDEDG